MRGKNQRIVFVVLIAVLAGIGYALHMYSQNSLRQKLTEQRRKVEVELDRLLEANAGARAAADEAAAKEKTTQNEAKAAEAAREKSENDRKAAEENAAAQKQEKENIEEKRKLAQEETVRAEKAAVAAEAEKKRLEAEKAAAEAKAKELAAQREKDEMTLKITVEARAQSEADAARKLAEQKKAEAEKAKSENDLQAAQKLAAARRDERLLMYKLGGVSDAERKEVQRAEKLLKAMEAWEAGLLSPEALAAVNALPAAEEATGQAPVEEDTALAEEMEKMRAREKEKAPPPPNPQDVKIKALGEKRDQALTEGRRRRSEAVVARYEPLYLAAKSAGRTHDADYYLSILKSMVDNYEPPKPKASQQDEK
ncbi:MAG: hypothetical protein IJJ84_03550 [Kiritimatiellae bacterium]|nr:hypothetical protein [Kiritimatiellia bacterium]